MYYFSLRRRKRASGIYCSSNYYAGAAQANIKLHWRSGRGEAYGYGDADSFVGFDSGSGMFFRDRGIACKIAICMLYRPSDCNLPGGVRTCVLSHSDRHSGRGAVV